MKMKELIKEGVITEQQAKIGYVAAYPYAEVISGYTAFLLGVRSVVPDAVMTVRYTNKWNDYRTEKKYAKGLIDEGCVIISQHSDTAGPATACEETAAGA
jgi:basic membrane lipoprotein Med (substrate-binding protein (PBP1-ABC) superfamily)